MTFFRIRTAEGAGMKEEHAIDHSHVHMEPLQLK